MILTKGDVETRWSADEVLALWASYDENTDEAVHFWTAPDGSQLCCDCASNFDAEGGFDDESSPLEDDFVFDPRIGCDDCKTVIAFD